MKIHIPHPFFTHKCAFWSIIFLQIGSLLSVSLTGLDHLITGLGKAFATPTVILDSARVTGITSGSTNQFLGIPFAQPPTGDLRFRLPQRLPPYNTDFLATNYGPACPQHAFKFPLPLGLPAETIDCFSNSIYNIITPSAEDCLTLNVVTPNGVTPASKLPVVVWFFGGGFGIGGTNIYNGSVIVEKSISLGVPAIFVSMNYRLNAFGFLASREVRDAKVGNLGLHDQRLALQWIQKYITAFGGDPTKVTIWGESAGAISVALHMVTNGGNPDGLFRAAFMQSGSPIPVGDITHGQPYYDALVDKTGCSGAKDTLQCLREVPYEVLLEAVNLSPGIFAYQSLALAWVPRVDGVFLTSNPQYLVMQGSVANVPFINGDCEDEGTLFSFSTLNISTGMGLADYLHTYWMPNASISTIAELLEYYSFDPAEGSPFGTGYLNVLTLQFKRIAALQGDMVFQAPRRLFLECQSGKQNIWTYVNKRFKWVPFLGSFHASDILNVFGGSDMAAYLVRFVTNLDPNIGKSTDLYWPKYDAKANKTMLEFLDGLVPLVLTTDSYRTEAIAYLTDVMLMNPL